MAFDNVRTLNCYKLSQERMIITEWASQKTNSLFTAFISFHFGSYFPIHNVGVPLLLLYIKTNC